jgi:hypothetical protein
MSEDDVEEVQTTDGRQVLYSTDENADEAADTDEWIASSTSEVYRLKPSVGT